MAKVPRTRRKTGRPAPGRLRIVAGKWRRRLLPVAAVDGLRPTAERIRETLFNWLANDIDGARCLDLCAGSGALGFEALSRGAASAVLVEISPAALRALQESRDTLGADDADIVAADVQSWLATAATAQFDIVFVDPPYAAALQSELCRLLVQNGWLADRALVYVEHPRTGPGPDLPADWRILRDKTAGAVRYLLAGTGNND